MKLTQVKGNTWVAEGREFIPFYRLEDGRCILLDAGLRQEGEELAQSLLDAGMTPAALVCTHTHVDHSGAAAWLQKEFHLPVAVSAGEAAVVHSHATLKAVMGSSPEQARTDYGYMVLKPDIILPDEDSELELLGVPLRIIHTPGHSPSHICIITPDNVCHVGDVLLSPEMYYAKLPYSMDIATDLVSKERMRTLGCDVYIASHRGILADINNSVDANRELFLLRAGEILSAIHHPMTFSQVTAAVYQMYSLFSRSPRRAQSFERNIRFFMEFLLDEGRLELIAGEEGVTLYAPTRQTPQK